MQLFWPNTFVNCMMPWRIDPKTFMNFRQRQGGQSQIALLLFWTLCWIKNPFCNRDFVPFLLSELSLPFLRVRFRALLPFSGGSESLSPCPPCKDHFMLGFKHRRTYHSHRQTHERTLSSTLSPSNAITTSSLVHKEYFVKDSIHAECSFNRLPFLIENHMIHVDPHVDCSINAQALNFRFEKSVGRESFKLSCLSTPSDCLIAHNWQKIHSG